MATRAFCAALLVIACLMIGCSSETPSDNQTQPSSQPTATATPVRRPSPIPSPTPAAAKFELSEAESKSLVKVAVTGDGLQRIDVNLESKNDERMEINIVPGTIFKAGSGGTQNMVVREERTVVLITRGSRESVSVDVACTNMHRAAPEGTSRFSISHSPTAEDLQKLLTLPAFKQEDFRTQQFAIWTITDNPGKYGYVGLGSGGDGSGPSDAEFESIKELFGKAGISTRKYRALR